MKRFNMVDESFNCENCGYHVDKLNYTARDHCPKCLYSKHVDILPGDRKEQCQGLLKPIEVETDAKNEFTIVYKCQKCGAIRKNKIAKDDDRDVIIKISTKEY